jgi:hypothetical protein
MPLVGDIFNGPDKEPLEQRVRREWNEEEELECWSIVLEK